MLAAGPADAAPNGLTQIPIAKVFGNGVAAFSLAQTEEQFTSALLTAQYGIGNQMELGLDYQATPRTQRTLLGNLKVLLAHRPGRLPDIACGLLGIATGYKPQPYAVATTQPRALGVSLGVIRTGGGAFYDMAGVSYNVTPTVEMVADRIDGKQGYGSLGTIASISKTVTVNLALTLPNTAGNAALGTHPTGYVVNISYTFHVRHAHGSSGGTPGKNPASGTGGAG